MAKTKPIGVRFDEPLLKEIIEQEKFISHQSVLSFLENYYKVSKLVNSPKQPQAEIKNALNSTETKKEVKSDSNFEKHKLWKQGDPKENTNWFFMRYDCWNYEELETIKAHKQ